jgi:hypothetical protein
VGAWSERKSERARRIKRDNRRWFSELVLVCLAEQREREEPERERERGRGRDPTWDRFSEQLYVSMAWQ